jgi:hypothetical protein
MSCTPSGYALSTVVGLGAAACGDTETDTGRAPRGASSTGAPSTTGPTSRLPARRRRPLGPRQPRRSASTLTSPRGSTTPSRPSPPTSGRRLPTPWTLATPRSSERSSTSTSSEPASAHRVAAHAPLAASSCRPLAVLRRRVSRRTSAGSRAGSSRRLREACGRRGRPHPDCAPARRPPGVHPSAPAHDP